MWNEIPKILSSSKNQIKCFPGKNLVQSRETYGQITGGGAQRPGHGASGPNHVLLVAQRRQTSAVLFTVDTLLDAASYCSR